MQHLQQMNKEKNQLLQERNWKVFNETSQEEGQIADNAKPAAVLENDREQNSTCWMSPTIYQRISVSTLMEKWCQQEQSVAVKQQMFIWGLQV